jgi:hypothetical protein
MKYLTRKQAAEYLREKGETVRGVPVKDGYLRYAARAGIGPQFRYRGLHPVYTEADLDAWIEARREGCLEAFLQFKHLPLGQPTRTCRRRRRRKQPTRRPHHPVSSNLMPHPFLRRH